MRVEATVVLFHTEMHLVESLFISLFEQANALSAVWVLHSACFDREGCEVADAIGSGAVEVSIICRPDNLGFAGGHNWLMSRAFDTGAEWVFVANPDLRLDSRAVAELLRSIGTVETSGPAVHGPRLMLESREGRTQLETVDSAGIRWTRSRRHFDADQGLGPTVWDGPRSVAGVTGAALFVSASSWRLVVDVSGHFFDPLFIAYREDAELGLRVIELGGSCWVHPVVGFVHARGSVNGARSSVVQRQLGVQNRFLLKYRLGGSWPGANPFIASMRDVFVLIAVILNERESLPAFLKARGLRGTMRGRHDRVRRMATRFGAGLALARSGS